MCDTPKPTLRELQLRAKLRADLHHEPAAVGDMGGPLRPADDADVADAFYRIRLPEAIRKSSN